VAAGFDRGWGADHLRGDQDAQIGDRLSIHQTVFNINEVKLSERSLCSRRVLR
jgi:hypothetical protein